MINYELWWQLLLLHMTEAFPTNSRPTTHHAQIRQLQQKSNSSCTTSRAALQIKCPTFSTNTLITILFTSLEFYSVHLQHLKMRGLPAERSVTSPNVSGLRRQPVVLLSDDSLSEQIKMRSHVSEFSEAPPALPQPRACKYLHSTPSVFRHIRATFQSTLQSCVSISCRHALSFL